MSATRKCSACDLLMVDGLCPHCDGACNIRPCRHCKQMAAHEGVGPGSPRWNKGLRP